MPPGQTIWLTASVILFCLTSALAADKKKNDYTDLVHDKQPENKTGFKLMEDSSQDCNLCECDKSPCYDPTMPTPEPIFPMMVHVESSTSACCEILEDAVSDLNKTWTDLNSTAITLISVEKVANRCSYYDGVLKPCRPQCPLYAIMCDDPKQFVEEFQCLKRKPREKTYKMKMDGSEVTIQGDKKHMSSEIFSACAKEYLEFNIAWVWPFHPQNKSGVFCRTGQRYLECVARLIQNDCGPIAKALYMNGKVWNDVDEAKNSIDYMTDLDKLIRMDLLNLTEFDQDCFTYLNFRINSTLLGSSSSHNTAHGTLIAVILVIYMLPLEITITLAQNCPKASIWMMAVLILGLATGLVLSDDPAPQTCEPCTTTFEGISSLCCQPFLQPLVIDDMFLGKILPTGEPIHVNGPVSIMLKEETLKARCGLYNESLKDCKTQCPLYGLICDDVPMFLDGFKCYRDRLENLNFQVNRDQHGLQPYDNRSEIVCESLYNDTQWSKYNNVSDSQKCTLRFRYWQCVEKTFNETCPGIGAWLGLMNFFKNSKEMYYKVPESIENECLVYANYIGKHTSPPGSSSPWNAAVSLGMVVAAVINGVVGHHILMNFR